MNHDVAAVSCEDPATAPGPAGRPESRSIREGVRWYTVGCAACIAFGCDSGVASRTFVERDSAGIRIVDNNVPQWGDQSGWQVVDPPLVDIGVDDGSAVYQLFDVRMAVRQSDGTIVVLNGGTQELRFYDAVGQHIRSVGRRGSGPGEYTTLEFVAVLPGDSLLAFNRTPAQVSILTPDGQFVRSFNVPAPANRRTFFDFDVAGLMDGQRLVVWSQPIYAAGYVESADGMNRHPHPIGVADLRANAFDSVAQAPGWDVWVEKRADGSSSMAAPPFARSSDIVARGNHIYVAPTEQLGITVLDAAGNVSMKARASAAAPEVTEEDMQALKEDLFERFSVPESQRPEAERVFASLPRPARFPLFRGADVDADGNIWLHAYPRSGEDPQSAQVFSPEGRWLGEVAVPAGLKRVNELEPAPLEIGADYVLGVWQDEADVDHVRLYRLAKRGPGT